LLVRKNPFLFKGLRCMEIEFFKLQPIRRDPIFEFVLTIFQRRWVAVGGDHFSVRELLEVRSRVAAAPKRGVPDEKAFFRCKTRSFTEFKDLFKHYRFMHKG